MNSKALMSFNATTMILRIVFVIGILFACVTLINMLINSRFQTSDLQAELLINGLLYSPGGITYTDPITGRTYPEIIDTTSTTEKIPQDNFFYPQNNLITAKITIYKKQQSTPLKTIYYNKEWYDNWEPLLPLQHLPGLGGVTEYTKTTPIIIQTNGEKTLGKAKFQIIQPKSARRSSQQQDQESTT